MDLQLAGRVVLVTGASEGIGLATACAFGREGSSVVLCARDPERLDAAVACVLESGAQKAIGYSADMTQPGDVEDAVGMTQELFGHVDVLVNNAGGTHQLGTFDDLNDEEWLDVIELNLLSVVRACRAVLPAMRARGWGRIINVAPDTASHHDELFPHYAAAKAAVISLTKSLARHTSGQDICVNAVSPALIWSAEVRGLFAEVAESNGISADHADAVFLERSAPHLTAARTGSPAQVASVIVMLASTAAAFVDGADIRIDSGPVAAVT
jgi:NAD(P)-dependent dehydrogenase (short-subunit alcohol dehydrogenase family)